MTATSLVAQESFSKISLSGFTVHLTQSDQFSIEANPDFEIEKTVKNDALYIPSYSDSLGFTVERIEDEVLYIGVIDQTGRVPKSTISISVKELRYLSLHNSVLVMDSAITVDSLDVMAACSFGELKVNANYLTITTGAGAQFAATGSAEQLVCNVGGASSLSASKLIADQADIGVMGYSQLYVNAKKVRSLDCAEDSRVIHLAK